MPEVTSGLYKVTFKQTFNSQECYNTFWYLENLERDDHQEDCAEAFDEDILPEMKLIQSTGVAYKEITVENVTGDLADAVFVPTTAAGVTTGTKQQSFVAAGFKRVRTTKETRNGAMRVTGLTEDDTTGNQYEAAYVTLIDAFAIILGAQIGIVGALFDPVIVKTRVSEEDPWVVNPIAVVTAQSNPTSQVSRKGGVGI